MEKRIPITPSQEESHIPTIGCSCHHPMEPVASMEEEHLKLVDDASIKQKTPQHKKRKWYHFFSPLLTFVQVLAIALFPKCPICWAAYMGMLGSIGLGNLSYQPWLYPVLIGTLAIYFAALLYRAKFRNGYGPFLVSLGGALLLGLFQWLEITALMYLAVAFFLMGSIWNVLPKQWVLRLTGSRLSI